MFCRGDDKWRLLLTASTLATFDVLIILPNDQIFVKGVNKIFKIRWNKKEAKYKQRKPINWIQTDKYLKGFRNDRMVQFP